MRSRAKQYPFDIDGSFPSCLPPLRCAMTCNFGEALNFDLIFVKRGRLDSAALGVFCLQIP